MRVKIFHHLKFQTDKGSLQFCLTLSDFLWMYLPKRFFFRFLFYCFVFVFFVFSSLVCFHIEEWLCLARDKKKITFDHRLFFESERKKKKIFRMIWPLLRLLLGNLSSILTWVIFYFTDRHTVVNTKCILILAIPKSICMCTYVRDELKESKPELFKRCEINFVHLS